MVFSDTYLLIILLIWLLTSVYLSTRTRTRTNTNPNGTEANAAGRSVRAILIFTNTICLVLCELMKMHLLCVR